jgi:hypothetical protein
MKPMPPGTFAGKALDAIAENEAIIVDPPWWKLFWWMDRLYPKLTMLQLRKQAMGISKG